MCYDGQKEPTVNKFTDIRNGTYYSNAAIWASNQAISAGESATVFGPNTMVTREELASMLYNFARYKGVSVTNTGSLTAYTDASTIAVGYQDAVKWAIANGIIEGTTPTTVAPKQTASRAEVVAMLSRFINLLEK